MTRRDYAIFLIGVSYAAVIARHPLLLMLVLGAWLSAYAIYSLEEK